MSVHFAADKSFVGSVDKRGDFRPLHKMILDDHIILHFPLMFRALLWIIIYFVIAKSKRDVYDIILLVAKSIVSVGAVSYKEVFLDETARL